MMLRRSRRQIGGRLSRRCSDQFRSRHRERRVRRFQVLVFVQLVDRSELLEDVVTSVVAERVNFFFPTAGAGFDVARNGTVGHTTNTVVERLSFYDRSGRQRPFLEEHGAYTSIDVSPDGRKAAIPVRAQATGLTDIWIYDLVRGVGDRLTSDVGMEVYPVWTPDGRALVYAKATDSPPRLAKRSLSAPTSQWINAPGVFQVPGSIASDGTLYYASNEPKTRHDIFRANLDGSRAEKILGTEFNEMVPTISGDGRLLAFISDASRRQEVYVLDLATSERTRISNAGGYLVRWSPAGELFYVTMDNRVVSAKPRVAGRWDDVVTTELFRATADIGAFDVMPDGQSFLISQWTAGPADAHIHVVTGQ
jgi:hypothetical protein